jgi:hypothetical protein
VGRSPARGDDGATLEEQAAFLQYFPAFDSRSVEACWTPYSDLLRRRGPHGPDAASGASTERSPSGAAEAPEGSPSAEPAAGEPPPAPLYCVEVPAAALGAAWLRANRALTHALCREAGGKVDVDGVRGTVVRCDADGESPAEEADAPTPASAAPNRGASSRPQNRQMVCEVDLAYDAGPRRVRVPAADAPCLADAARHALGRASAPSAGELHGRAAAAWDAYDAARRRTFASAADAARAATAEGAQGLAPERALIRALSALVQGADADAVPLGLRADLALAYALVDRGTELADVLLEGVARDCDAAWADKTTKTTDAARPGSGQPLNASGDAPAPSAELEALGPEAFRGLVLLAETCGAALRSLAFVRTTAWGPALEDFSTSPTYAAVLAWHSRWIDRRIHYEVFELSPAGRAHAGSLARARALVYRGRSVFDVGAAGEACRHPWIGMPPGGRRPSPSSGPGSDGSPEPERLDGRSKKKSLGFSRKETCTDEPSWAGKQSALLAADGPGLYLDLMRRALLAYPHSAAWEHDLWARSSFGLPPMAWGMSWVATFGGPDGAPLRAAERDARAYQSSLSNGDLVGMTVLLERLLLRRQVRGDLLEAGVYRGGTSIYLRAFLAAHAAREGMQARKVWVADSFEGVPAPRQGFRAPAHMRVRRRRAAGTRPGGVKPSPSVRATEGSSPPPLATETPLATDRATGPPTVLPGTVLPRQGGSPPIGEDLCVDGVCTAEADPVAAWRDMLPLGEDVVRDNFRRYGLDDGRVEYARGFFNESLPLIFGDASGVDVEERPALALLRIDADGYDGYIDVLDACYDRLSPGGIVLVDDWHLFGAQAAVHAFRAKRNVTAPILPLPSDFVYTCRPPMDDFVYCGMKRGEATPEALVARSRQIVVATLPRVVYWEKPMA